ncbi:hypothetical protein JQ586_31475 [Bradyrhizobium jicamae]|nr:hypothetical protein [Bradyrhizobium jicamae]MBR0937881.1 hypothetical protein [Bradyrhizobium jicamae]
MHSVAKAGCDLGFIALNTDAFGTAKVISIDYAVMEKAAHAAVVPVVVGCRPTTPLGVQNPETLTAAG